MRSSKSSALASRRRRVYCRKISRNMTSCGSFMFALRAYVSTSASSFLSFEILRLRARRGEAHGVGVELFDDALEDRALVGGVVDRERRARARCASASRRRMRTHAEWNVEIHIPDAPFAEQRLDALAHLGGGLVGERDREDLARPRLAALDEARDAVREHAGLAGARARDDEQRRAAVLDRLALLGVEPVGEARTGRTKGHQRVPAAPRASRPGRRGRGSASCPINSRRGLRHPPARSAVE